MVSSPLSCRQWQNSQLVVLTIPFPLTTSLVILLTSSCPKSNVWTTGVLKSTALGAWMLNGIPSGVICIFGAFCDPSGTLTGSSPMVFFPLPTVFGVFACPSTPCAIVANRKTFSICLLGAMLPYAWSLGTSPWSE